MMALKSQMNMKYQRNSHNNARKSSALPFQTKKIQNPAEFFHAGTQEESTIKDIDFPASGIEEATADLNPT